MTNKELLDLAKINTMDYTLPQLKNIAKLLGLTGYSKMRKSDLSFAVVKRQQEIIEENTPPVVLPVTSSYKGMSFNKRITGYRSVNGSKSLTKRQQRRIKKKFGRALSQGVSFYSIMNS